MTAISGVLELVLFIIYVGSMQAEIFHPALDLPTAKSLLETHFGSSSAGNSGFSDIAGRELSTNTFTSAESATGFTYYEFYSGRGCSGDMTYSSGVPTGVCLPSIEYDIPGDYYAYGDISSRPYQSFSISNVQANCKNTVITFYQDSACQIQNRVQQLTVANVEKGGQIFTDCYNNPHPGSNMATSYIGKCSVGSGIPISKPSYVYSEYNSTDKCNVAPMSFEAYAVDVCFSTSNISSTSFSCSSSGGNITMAQYYDSNVCVANSQFDLQTNLTITAGCFGSSTKTSVGSQYKYSFKKTQCVILGSSNSNQDALSTAAIVGIVIGSVAVVALIAFLAAYFVFGVGMSATSGAGNDVDNDKDSILRNQA